MAEAKHQVDELIEFFNLMWGNFPILAQLIHKDRTVMALNRIALAQGKKPGKKCFEFTGRSKVCPHCEANEAMRDKTGRGAISYNWPLQQLRDCYWVPVPGHEDYYVHCGINITDYGIKALFDEKRAVAEKHFISGP